MRIAISAAVIVAVAFGAAAVLAESKRLRSYGTMEDVAFAKSLWGALRRARLVGPNRNSSWPTTGKEPHGAVQQITAAQIRVKGRMARVIVKVNHRGENITPKAVYAEPNRFLTGYPVMFKRGPRYHPEAQNWFWVVFNPDGSLREFKGRPIAGRVDTGNDDGCIGCHRKKGGADFEALTPM